MLPQRVALVGRWPVAVVVGSLVSVIWAFYAPRNERPEPRYGSGDSGRLHVAESDPSRQPPETAQPTTQAGARAAATPTSHRAPLLVDVAELVGLQFRYFTDRRTDRFFLPEIMGGGAAWLDYDGNAWLDLFLANGCVLPDKGDDDKHTGRLFRSHEATLFADTSIAARADDRGYGQGVGAADYNNDGFPDLYVTHVGGNRLLANNGDGTFTDRTVEAAVGSSGWSTSCCFGDLDRDGDVDLYVAHYARVTLESSPVCTYPDQHGREVRGYCGPDKYEGELAQLYANLGDGTFREVSQQVGGQDRLGKGLAVIIADLNNDTWPDIYLAADMVANSLFWNAGAKLADPLATMLFEEGGVASGAGLTDEGRNGASMGIGCADYDHNGWLDLVITNYLDQGMNLYRNDAGKFMDIARGANLLIASLPYLGFGTVFFDYDNDGWQDIFVTNGHVLGPLVGPPDRMRGQVFRNIADGRFAEVTDEAGPYFYQEFFGRGLAYADFTNTGATGMVVVHQDEPVSLLRNDTPGRGHYLGLQLVGRQSNRCALNARATAKVNGEPRMAEVIGGGSYLSESDHRVLFGLGQAQSVDEIEVQWPSGRVERWPALQGDRYWLIIEGHAPRLQRPVAQASARSRP